MNEDQQQLDLLGIFHFVLGGLVGLSACIPLIHLSIGIAMVSGLFGQGGDGPPPAVGWMFIAIATLIITLGWTLATCLFVAGRHLRRRTGHLFCTVVAGIECIMMPLGTLLGVFSLIVLMRDSVKALFAESSANNT